MKYNLFYSSKINIVKQFNNTMKPLLILLLAIFLAGCAGKNPQNQAAAPPSLPVMRLVSSDEITYQEFPASIQGTIDLEIRPQVSGILERIFVNEGARVEKGGPLFKIDERPFQEAVNNAKGSLESAKATQINAQLEVEKLTPLVANKVIADFQLKTAKANYQSAKANVEQAKAAVATANINLSYTLIKAPVNGFVGRLPKKQGSLISVNDLIPLTLLSDAHEVHVYFSLGEDDFINFNDKYPGKSIPERLGKLPGVSLVLSDKKVYQQEGRIDMVDGQFDKQTGSIALRATFPNPQGLLKSGNTGKLRLAMIHPNAVLIPQSSTIEIQDKMFVYTLESGNKVSKTPITILGTTGTNYLVKEGLKAGDQLVFDGIGKLKEGEVIKPEKVKQDPTKTTSR
jgi:membrane fusion protein (multidrug efflux system)